MQVADTHRTKRLFVLSLAFTIYIHAFCTLAWLWNDFTANERLSGWSQKDICICLLRWYLHVLTNAWHALPPRLQSINLVERLWRDNIMKNDSSLLAASSIQAMRCNWVAWKYLVLHLTQFTTQRQRETSRNWGSLGATQRSQHHSPEVLDK